MTENINSPESADEMPDEADEQSMTAAEEAWDIAKTVLIAVAVTLFVRFFFFQPFNIPSASMQPTLMVGDFVVVNKMSHGYSKASLIYPLTRMPSEGRLFGSAPDAGEVIVFKNPYDRNRDYIKRVIGTAGDRIQVIGGVLHINGQPVEREYLADRRPECSDPDPRAKVYRETMPDGGPSYIVQECHGDNYNLDNTKVFTVGEGQLFMMGDNRDNSSDSRTPIVQMVEMHQVVGRATNIAFSVDGSKAHLWEPWKWPMAIRYSRMFDHVE
ncbi:signal peptidase I [Parvularcula sp. LCG005]|uniref:signal peptidase I n=1 Tax=Parvularcula sp. LCG005 TaxID=3078805 RepID=UPI0029437086|nr:signal peptidase I [Parvularcula sp. LCG005]WOI54257.1 signal peptidase I [Parvularcula sp. LCG005]